jgi:Ca-activated chloride channel family protein
MSSDIDLNCTVNREYIQTGKKAAVYLSLDIIPPEATEVLDTMKPLNICIAIDRSGSMREENKIGNAKLATNQLIQALKPTDYVSIVSFSDNKRVEVDSQPANHVGVFQKAVESINAKGSTDIHSALQASFEQIMRQNGKFTEVPVNRIILLTDGQPTVGKKSIDDFVVLSETIRRNNMSVTVLGLGSDYNEQLLSAVASTSDGSWYHVTDPTNLPCIFSEELLEMKTIVMVKPELQIQPMNGAQITDIYKVRPVLDQIKKIDIKNETHIIPLGDLVGGQPQNIVMKVELPPKNSGTYQIAQATLASGKNTITREVKVNYTDDTALFSKESDPYPRVLLLTSEGTILLRQGVASGDETLITQAQTLLKQTFTDPNVITIVKTSELIQNLVGRFNNSYEATIIKKGNLSQEDKKKVISETTVIKKQATK